MFRSLKNNLYFPVAGYFKFFAAIHLKRWQPRVIVVTGSNGKTTTLHLIESQLQTHARYSHKANSAFGIPFDILGLRRTSFSIFEWLTFFLLAPIRAFKQPAEERIYVVEADCDRPGEGRFLASLLKPEVTIWLSCARTHSYNFDKIVMTKRFANVDEAIAHEFGHFATCTSGQIIYNADEKLIVKQLSNKHAQLSPLTKRVLLSSYKVSLTGTIFTIDGMDYALPYLLPEVTFYSIIASLQTAAYFGIRTDPSYSKLQLPPGRCSLFKGIKGTTIVDSSYNANLSSTTVILSMTNQLECHHKWLILGDLIEQGMEEKEEHEKLARLITESNFEKVILVGPRLAKYTLPLLRENSAITFAETADALHYLLESIKGGEVLVFKGARYLEGIIERLLEDENDVANLCRREERFQIRRKQWNL